MRPPQRTALASLALALIGAAMIWGTLQLPRYGESRGPDEQRWHAAAVHDRHLTNLDAFVNFDLRGFDTLGEELLLFTAVSGLALLLRDRYGPVEDDPFVLDTARRFYPRSEAVRWVGVPLLGLGIVFGIAVVVHGQLTPGGGFQGGVVIGSAMSLTYFAQSYRSFNQLGKRGRNDAFEAIGAAAYAAVGLIGLVSGGAFLQNVLPLGHVRDVFSAGTVWLIDAAVGLEVTFGFTILFAEYLKQTRKIAGEDVRR